MVFGVYIFDLLGLKGDLGALYMGLLLAGHKKTREIVESIFYIKELCLIFFFVSIGLKGLLSLDVFLLSLCICLLLPLKLALFFLIFKFLGLPLRSNFFSTISLTNYSEFGFIVSSVCISNALLPESFMITLAISLSVSFLIFSPIQVFSERIFFAMRNFLLLFYKESEVEKEAVSIDKPEYIVLGMGMIGAEVYKELTVYNNKESVLGIDHSVARIEKYKQAGFNVFLGDATDIKFATQLNYSDNIKHIFLCMPYHNGNILSLENIKKSGYKNKVSAISYYDEEIEFLKEEGVHNVKKLYESAGVGFIKSIMDA